MSIIPDGVLTVHMVLIMAMVHLSIGVETGVQLWNGFYTNCTQIDPHGGAFY